MTAAAQAFLTGAMGWLDVLPDGLRALLAALVLAGVLSRFEKRIPIGEIQYGQSFRKAALVALLVIPLFVWLVPASRMVVFVEALPRAPASLSWIAIGTCLVWLSGVAVSSVVTLLGWRRQRQAVRSLPVVADDRLTSRLAHWRARLGMHAPAELHTSPDDRPRFLDSSARLLFPAAALRWPTNQQDVLIINGLCSLKRHHHRWHRFARFVSCVYWPVTWVQRLHGNLLRDFELTAGALADSCYQDRLGYGRSLRQLEQRLAPATRLRAGNERRDDRPVSALRRYRSALADLLRPDDPPWQVEALVAARTDGSEPRWKDPYDRVVLFVGQAIFLAVLTTGVTLRERPPETEDRYLMPFGLLWKEHFHRNLELRDKVQPDS